MEQNPRQKRGFSYFKKLFIKFIFFPFKIIYTNFMSSLFFILFLIFISCLGWGLWLRRPLSPELKKQKYKDLESRAKEGEVEAMYQLAELYYQDHDERYYPMIFKWVSILASQKKDPAVWLLMGDLYNSASGTVRDAKRALDCYEQALSADIASGKNTDLDQEAHNYLEKQIIELRKEVFG